MASTTSIQTCWCGDATHEAAVCRHCGESIVRHSEPGLMAWFARSSRSSTTFANGECYRDAMNGSHSPGTPGRMASTTYQPTCTECEAHRATCSYCGAQHSPSGALSFHRVHAFDAARTWPAASHYVTRLQSGDTSHHAVVAATPENMR